MELKKTTQPEAENRTRFTLILRVKDQHDEASWEDFVHIYHGYIYAIIRKMNISTPDTEDLTQQLLLNIWNKLPQTEVHEIRRFRSWLAKITRDLVIDFIRKRSRESKRLEQVEQDSTMFYLDTVNLSDIERIAEQEWKLHIAHLALTNIEPFFSGQAIKVFRLNFEGMGINEIAKKLDLKENSVYRLRNRVKKRLIQEISQLREELE